MDTLDDYLTTRPATASRPLLGLTLLVVEDSRFASEAMRLLCLRSGARIRRADSLFAAHRHLRVYRPSAVIVDMGLPDGSGAELIAELAAATPRIDVILGTSADPDAESVALSAGADGFLAKPLSRLAAFQAAILTHLPDDEQPLGPGPAWDDLITPDPLAYLDDLAHVAECLSTSDRDRTLPYLMQLLGGVAKSTGDHDIVDAVAAVAGAANSGVHVTRLAALLQSRLAQAGPI